MIWDFHRRRHRDDLEHVVGQVVRLFKKRARGWYVDEELCMQHCHARARDIDHDFGRVDQHRGIAGLKVGRYSELRGVKNDRKDVVRTERPEEANDVRKSQRC